jgi:trimethylamine--corrinoid protein Co-methyltransferase
MAELKIEILTPEEIQQIHETSLHILEKVGVMVHHKTVLQKLAEGGAKADFAKQTIRFKPDLVLHALDLSAKQYILHGRDPQKVAKFGHGELNLISSPGQYAWFDHHTGLRRGPTLQDVRLAARVGDALPNITIVGAMAVPTDVPAEVKDVSLTAELVKATGKPTRCWPVSRKSSHYVLEIYTAMAGGKAALRMNPMTETLLEPISPLQLPETGVDVLLEFLEYGQPVSVGPMVMASGTGPATLAGTLAQENAEILAAITTIQMLAPGTPILYGGIPHIMDAHTSICSFGSPEQGLMAVAMTQIGKHYGLPVYINVNLTDAKTLDVQAGMENMGSFVLGILAGADLFGHAGIVGTDHGGSLPWLAVDNEAMNYARRISRGFVVDPETLAEQVIADVGPTGNFLAQAHTVKHFRDEFWLSNPLWAREPFDGWFQKGASSMEERANAKVDQIISHHETEPLEAGLEKEIDHIVRAAKRDLAV